jgi:hypothetical protein
MSGLSEEVRTRIAAVDDPAATDDEFVGLATGGLRPSLTDGRLSPAHQAESTRT